VGGDREDEAVEVREKEQIWLIFLFDFLFSFLTFCLISEKDCMVGILEINNLGNK
jgi:hypothetical protein